MFYSLISRACIDTVKDELDYPIDMDDDQDVPITPSQHELTRTRLRKGTRITYIVSFLFILVVTAWGFYDGYLEESMVGFLMVIILGMTIFTERESINVPPNMVIMVIIASLLAIAGGYTVNGGPLEVLSKLITGINLGLIGLIVVYMLLRPAPRSRDENIGVVAFISISISIASFALLKLLQYMIMDVGLINQEFNSVFNTREMMVDMSLILIGSLITAGFHVLGGKNAFGGALNSFLEVVGTADIFTESMEIINEGESDRVEFKSTLRTNLQTNEVDKRMEKAVLKSMVAFLNTDGGDLFIGVTDDKKLEGADLYSFDDNEDKMGLHLSNLITAQIGAEYIPYIDTYMFHVEEKGEKPRIIIRVRCSSCPQPVFLKDGKVEIFYIRNGPRTEEITGMKLVNYIQGRMKKRRKAFA